MEAVKTVGLCREVYIALPSVISGVDIIFRQEAQRVAVGRVAKEIQQIGTFGE